MVFSSIERLFIAAWISSKTVPQSDVVGVRSVPGGVQEGHGLAEQEFILVVKKL